MAARLSTDRHYRSAAKRMLAGKVVPFLGAGANLCGRGEGLVWSQGCGFLPNGHELANRLAEEVEYPDPNDRDLMRISQYVESDEGWGTLYEYVRVPFDAQYEPTALHRFLASVAVRLRAVGKPRQVILTTNYDDALEQAFDELGEPYDLIWYQAQPQRDHCGYFMHARPDGPRAILIPNEYDELDPDERTVIVKLHGAMVRENEQLDSYVITEDDYIRYLARADVTGQIPAVLRTRIKDSHLLFLGYGMRDWNLRVVLERIGGSEVMSHQAWCVQREPPTQEAKEIEQTLWGDRDIDLVYIPLDVYVEKLEAQLAPLSQAA